MVWRGAVARARLRQHQREVRRAVERARRASVGRRLLLQREIRLRADHAVIVLDLVGELQRTARLRLRLLGERDRRRAIRNGGERERDVLVEHAAQGRGAAIRDGVAMLLGAGRRRRRAFAARLGDAAAGDDFEPACAARADHQHASRRHGLDQRGLMRLAGADAGQDHRRLAGVGRRRHPGVDAEILRLHHAGPVERRGDALHALAGRGKERRADEQHDQRAHRDRIEQMQARTRRPGLERIRGAQRLFDMRAPERLRHLILLAGAQVHRRARSPAGASSRCRDRGGAARRTCSAGGSGTAEPPRPRSARSRTNSAIARPIGGSTQPQACPRDGEENSDRDGDRSKRRPQPLPENGPPGAAQRARQQRVGDCASIWRASASGSEGRSFTCFSVASHSLIWPRQTSNAQNAKQFSGRNVPISATSAS